MRNITRWQQFKIYFNTAPFIIGEGFCLGSIFLPIATFSHPAGLMAIIFALVGGFFVRRKLQNMHFGAYVLQHGLKTEAEVTQISNTSISHNERTVKEYHFQYIGNGKRFSLEYQSAYKRHLKLGSKMTLFYLEDDPSSSFIPELYNIKISSLKNI